MAIATAQASFVVGSVYLKAQISRVEASSPQSFEPVVFAFAREASAAPLLLLLAWLKGRLRVMRAAGIRLFIYTYHFQPPFTTLPGAPLPARQDALLFFLLGVCLFASQLLYMLGIDLSGVVVATCIQPAIPVFTALLSISLRQEAANPRKLVGIALSVLGATAMVFGGVSAGGHGAGADDQRGSMLVGNVCLVFNTAAMAVYYVYAKQLVARYPPLLVAAWAYVVAAALMGVAAVMVVPLPRWPLPAPLLGPLAYWVVICSVLGYYVVAWGMQTLPASQVAAFQCLQPFLGTVLAASLLGEALSAWDGGALGVVAGLVLVCSERGDTDTAILVARARKLIRTQMRRVPSKGAFLLPSAIVPGAEQTPRTRTVPR